jgi:hypothetical protein
MTRNQTKNQTGLKSAQTRTEMLNRDNISNAGLRKIIQEEVREIHKVSQVRDDLRTIFINL